MLRRKISASGGLLLASVVAKCFLLVFVAGQDADKCRKELEFSCRTTDACVPWDKVLDGHPDCSDGSDEDCSPCRKGSPKCIHPSQVGDEKIDCSDGSDEGCLAGWFICSDGNGCLPPDKVRDGIPDCEDESDETCESHQHECLCGYPRCLDPEYVGDGILDCIEGSDEMAIDKTTYICPKDSELQEIMDRRKRNAEPAGEVILESSLGVPGSNAVPRGRSIGKEDVERVNVKTKVFHNGVEVLVVDKNEEDPNDQLQIEPTTVSDQLFMGLPTRNHQFANFLRSAKPEFVTKIYYTTVTFYFTPPPGNTQHVEQRTKIISNVVTQEADVVYGQPTSSAQVTLSSDYLDPPLETKTQVTKFTYYNTLYYGDKPLVLSTEEVVSNIATIPKDPASATQSVINQNPLETKTYLSTYVFFKKLTENEQETVLTTQEVITQVVVTHVLDDNEIQAATLAESLQPTSDDPDTFLESSILYTDSPEITKTYFTTFTYMTTALVGEETVVNSDIVIKSEIVKEPFDLASPSFDFGNDLTSDLPEPLSQVQSLVSEKSPEEGILATRTYYVSYTYLSTIQYGDLTTVSSNVEVSSSIIVEPLDASENPSLWSQLVSAAIEPSSVTAALQPPSAIEASQKKQTVTYYRLGPNIYAQLRTVFANYATVVTGEDGFLQTVNMVSSNTVTSTITTNSLPPEVTVIDSTPPSSAPSKALSSSRVVVNVKSASSVTSSALVDPLKPSIITGSTVIFWNNGLPQLDLRPTPAFQQVQGGSTLFDRADATKITVTATESTTVPGSNGEPTAYPAGQVLVILDLGNGSTVGFPITGIDMEQKPQKADSGNQLTSSKKSGLSQGGSFGSLQNIQSVSQSISSSSSQAGPISPSDLASFSSSVSSLSSGSKPNSGTSASARPAGGSLISAIGSGLVNLGALAGALAAGNAGAQAVSGLDFSPIIDSVSNLFRSGVVNPFSRRNDTDSASKRDPSPKPDRFQFPEPDDELLPPRPPAVRSQGQPVYIPVGRPNPQFYEDELDFQPQNPSSNRPSFIPLRNNGIGGPQKRPRPMENHQEFRLPPPGNKKFNNVRPEGAGGFGEQNRPIPQSLPLPQRPFLQQQGQPPQRPFSGIHQPEFPPRPSSQEIERQESSRTNDIRNGGQDVHVLRGSGVPISPGQMLVARPDDDPNLVIGKPHNQADAARPPFFPGDIEESDSGPPQQPSAVQVGQSIRIASSDIPETPTKPASQPRPINPSRVSVVSGQETIFFSPPAPQPQQQPQQQKQQQQKRPFVPDTDRSAEEDSGNLLGSANTQQPATVPAPVILQELPNGRRPVNPLLKERPPPPIHLPRIIPGQPGQQRPPFQGPQRVPNGPIVPPRGLEGRPLPPLVRDPDGAPIIAKLPNLPNNRPRPNQVIEQPSRPQQQPNAGWSSVQPQPVPVRPSRPGVQWPAVQTVLSLGNGNRIVGTNIIRDDGEEIEVEEGGGFKPALPPPITFTQTPSGDSENAGTRDVIVNAPKLQPADLIESSHVERFPVDQDSAADESKAKGTKIRTGETTVYDVLYTRPQHEQNSQTPTDPMRDEVDGESEPSLTPGPATPPVIVGYIEDDGPPTPPFHLQPETSVADRGSDGADFGEQDLVEEEPLVTKFLTRTETVTRTMTATETSIFYVQGRPFTKTEIVTTTLPPRTVVTTVVGGKTEVNVLTTSTRESTAASSVTSSTSASSSVINAAPSSEADDDKAPEISSSRVVPPVDTDKATVGLGGLPTTTGPPSETSDSEEAIDNEINRGVEDTNEINRVIAGFIPEQGLSVEVPVLSAECKPGCSLEDNEVCQKKRGAWQCMCRPGFARKSPTSPCKETRTFKLTLPIERVQSQMLTFRDEFLDEKTPEFGQLEFMAKDAVERALRQSALGPSYHESEIMAFRRFEAPGKDPDTGVMVEVIAKVAPELNADEGMLMNHLRQSVRKSNYSLGGTALLTSPSFLESFYAEDFDECSSQDYHDCSEFAMCINRAGTFTCACKSGYQDLSDVADSRPGRICSSASSSCGHCNYHGECYTKEDGATACKCQKWYSGDRCQLNMKVLLIVLVTIGALLALGLCLATLVFCLRRKRSASSNDPRAYLYPATSSRNRAMDRRAMIGPGDTSSESSDHRSFPTMHEALAPPSIGRKGHHHKRPRSVASGRSLEVDRSLPGTTTMPPVIIPRAKYSSPSRLSSASQVVSLGPDPGAELATAERSLMSMLEGQQAQSVRSYKGSTRSHATSIGDDLRSERGRRAFRDMRRGSDGALIDAGVVVSAVGSRSKSSGRRPSEYSRGSGLGLGDRTVSEARSYDETTVRNVTRHPESYYSTSRPQSTQFFSEDGRTMAEREDGSSVWVPQSRLYKLAPDSDLGSETSSRTRDMRSSKVSSSPPH